MTDQILPCPCCQGQVSVASSRRFVRCTSCESSFVIRRDQAGQATLEFPGPALVQTVASSPGERAQKLELQILDTKEEAQLRQAEVDATTTAYWRGRLGLQRVVANSQNGTYLSGLLSAVAAFVAMFIQPTGERLFFGTIAVLLGLVALAFHKEWRVEDKLGQADLAGSRAAVTEARAAYDATTNRLLDLTCEQSICVGFSTGPNEAVTA